MFESDEDLLLRGSRSPRSRLIGFTLNHNRLKLSRLRDYLRPKRPSVLGPYGKILNMKS